MSSLFEDPKSLNGELPSKINTFIFQECTATIWAKQIQILTVGLTQCPVPGIHFQSSGRGSLL